jgi:HNH endonuclease
MIKNSHGKYVMLRFPNGERILEHRFVIETVLGRKLLPNEVVHHRDNNGKNNEIGNLQIMSPSEHSRHHGSLGKVDKLKIICPQCGLSFFKQRRRVAFDKRNGITNFCSRKCSGKFFSDSYWNNARSSNGSDA